WADHLAPKRRMLFLELALDQRMTGLPHDGTAAVLRDIVVHPLRAFHVADNRGARLLLQNRTRERHHQLVAPYDSAVLVDRTYAVRVAVVCDPDVGLAL